MRRISAQMAASVALGLVSMAAGAHFRLLEPASWIDEDERGNPQKLAPCGGTIDDPGTRTGARTAVTGGEMLGILVEETVFHPGHYRIALARRPNWLPADPVATTRETDRGPRSVAAAIEENPAPPVLEDGLWAHTERPDGLWETQIRIPNIDCEGCFLQVIQFMAEHPGVREGDFSYHHCAILDIAADPDLPVDAGW